VLLGGVHVKLSLKIRSPEVQSGLGFRVKSRKKMKLLKDYGLRPGSRTRGGVGGCQAKFQAEFPNNRLQITERKKMTTGNEKFLQDI
jgi:hypothetical protein